MTHAIPSDTAPPCPGLRTFTPAAQTVSLHRLGQFVTRILIAGVAAGALVLGAAYLGLAQWLGAHPWWATQVAWIGAPIGLVIAALMVTRRSWRPLGASAILTLIAFGAASLGKARFAASYAEDMLAGQIWYWGWIATALFAAATLTLLIGRVIGAGHRP